MEVQHDKVDKVTLFIFVTFLTCFIFIWTF